MTPDQVNRYYLRVGAERRKDERGETSKKFHRKVMGNKGVGKLAPFGICETIEIVSASGPRVQGQDINGKSVLGYQIAHAILHRNAILQDEETNYYPAIGSQDGRVSKSAGTEIILRNFAFRKVPTIAEFSRQLAQRFGITTKDWQITLEDSVKSAGDPDHKAAVGAFVVDTMPATKIELKPSPVGDVKALAFDESGGVIGGLDAGFVYEGKNYPVQGWVGYAKEPYKDDLMAGVRIYCRGKIAAQTNVFNRKAGFTGEHDVRSYLVGELHADWLDATEDLIQTDRRDILWSHELGAQFESWGQDLVRRIGSRSRDPMKKKTWDRFRETAQLDERVKTAFPREDQKELREKAIHVAKLVGQTIRPEEIDDSERIDNFVQLSLMLAPVISLDEQLRAAADSTDSPLTVVTEILRTARVAELASFGRIAEDRVRVIEKVETLKDTPATLEDTFQTLIATSPWLIDPQWSPITSNQAFTTLKRAFEKFYKQKTGEVISLSHFADGSKRADFVLSTQDGVLQVIEIKRPHHKLENEELDRIIKYRDLFADFLAAPGNKEFSAMFPNYHITLVCDGLNLNAAYKTAFQGMVDSEQLSHITWNVFLLRTRKMHQSFLEEADRLKREDQ